MVVVVVAIVVVVGVIVVLLVHVKSSTFSYMFLVFSFLSFRHNITTHKRSVWVGRGP